jgi:predicted Zn-dependent protease
MGLYPDSSLQKYVGSLGLKLASTSERPKLPWKYQVIDDPVVNAFALPGGFVYVTRGILAHLNNEAEFVGVLGHETGHVTAEHSVNQISTQQLMQLAWRRYGCSNRNWQQNTGRWQASVFSLTLKFSRDDEEQADLLGLRYMKKNNQDPRQLANVMEMLQRVSKASGGEGGGVPEWLSTHPDPGNRREFIEQEIAKGGADLSKTTVNRDQYLSRLDGMIYGENPREGYFKGTTFLHPDMKFRLEFPSGWQTQNQKQAVGDQPA